VLEAFAQQRPVVATRIGMEGIAAEDGRHALIADDPGTFATACLRFLHEPQLSARITREALQLFNEQYVEDIVAMMG
jgi:glycosyltransferase involved in cell wall biosynthesis